MNSQNSKILFISHDATRTGAPIVFLHHLKGLKEKGINFDILLKNGGELTSEFEKTGKVFIFKRAAKILSRVLNKMFNYKTFNSFFSDVLKNNYTIIYGNTVVSADLLMYAKKNRSDVKTICHIHELDVAIKTFFGEDKFRSSIPYIDHFIAASNAVKAVLVNNYKIDAARIHVHYEHIPLKTSANFPIKDTYFEGSANKLKICGSGTLDWRKGVDLFIQTAFVLKKINHAAKFHFYWIGGSKSTSEYAKAQYDIQNAGLSDHLTIIESCSNPLDYMQQCDLFLLTSREDPFPLVCLEAASLGKPIICFKKSGGMEEFVNEGNGWLIDYLDIIDLSTLLNNLAMAQNRSEIQKRGEKIKTDVEKFDITVGVNDLLKYFNTILNN